MSNPSPSFTIIDVLEGALDGDLTPSAIERLGLKEIAELGEAVQDFYDSWTVPEAPEGELRVHLGGWVAGNTALPGARDLLHTGLLYAHQVLVHDPIAAYFEPKRKALRGLPPIRHRSGMSLQASQGHLEATGGWVNFENLEGARSSLVAAVEALAPLGPLIKTGTVIPVPHLRVAIERQDAVETAVRHMIRDESFRTAVENPIDGPALCADDAQAFRIVTEPLRSRADVLNQNFGPPAFYLARSVAVADAFGATYLPPSATDWALFEDRLTQLSGLPLERSGKLGLRVVSAVARSRLPLITGLEASAVVRVRRDEEAFEDWRRALRRAVRQIESSPSSGAAFETESKEVLGDSLTPMAEEVGRAVRRSAILRDSVHDAKINLATGVAVAGTAGALGAAPPAAIATAAGGAFSGWLLRSIFPRRRRGAQAVIAHLLNDDPSAPALPRPGEALVVRPKHPFG